MFLIGTLYTVMFKDLYKLVISQIVTSQIELFKRLRYHSFWIWNISEHRKEISRLKEILLLQSHYSLAMEEK